MNKPTVRAELIEDRGEAAVSAEFFRSRSFLDAEGATHTLLISGDAIELVAPLLVREIEGTGGRDAVSPYGYPGLVERGGGHGHARLSNSGEAPPGRPMTPAKLDPADVDWSGTGLVSLFVRHRLGSLPLSGTTERTQVYIADPELPAKSRPSDRRQIRKNLEAGYEMAIVPGVETTADHRAAFLEVYEQTMRRTGAAAHYFFGGAYFDRVLEADRTWLALASAPDGGVAAASLAVVSDGYLHYYLSGSADSHLRDSPMKNVLAGLIELSAELGLPLNLGGGITPGDRLDEFKRGFGNRQEPWHSSEIVCDPERYEALSAGRGETAFFPAYRA